MGQQSMVGLLLKRRRLWHEGSLLSRLCCTFHSTHQGMQHADVVNNIRTGYEAPDVQNGGLLCHRLRVMETLPGDILSNKKTLGVFNGSQCSNKNMSMDCFIRLHHGDFSCYPKLFNTTTFEPASTSKSDTSGKTLSIFGATSSLKYSSSFVGAIPQIRTCSGLWSRRRRDPLWIGRRSFFSSGTDKFLSNLESESLESSALRMVATNATEAEANTSSSESDEDYDFRNFPALTSSFYQDYERPSEMKPKKRVAWQTSRELFNTDSKLTLESIPKPTGQTYDFGLGDMFSKPPPLGGGARPQGGFDIDLSLDECEEAPSERHSSSPIFPQRMPSGKPPWNTPEADNCSEISTDSQDSVSKHEQEFCWDPYDFDASVKLPHKLEIKESFSANVAEQ